MSLLRNIASGLRSLFRKEQVSQELDEELHGFLEMAVEEKMKHGLSRPEALRAVRLERGSLEVTKEVVRSAGWESFVEAMWQDLRFAARMLRKNPGFTSIAVLTLALGIGANTAVFSAIDTVLLQPLPYVHPEQLMLISESLPKLGGDDVGVAAGEYLDYRDRNRSFAQAAAYQNDGFNLTGAGEPLRVTANRATASLFPLLGVRPILGRTFTDEEGRPGADAVV